MLHKKHEQLQAEEERRQQVTIELQESFEAIQKQQAQQEAERKTLIQRNKELGAQITEEFAHLDKETSADEEYAARTDKELKAAMEEMKEVEEAFEAIKVELQQHEVAYTTCKQRQNELQEEIQAYHDSFGSFHQQLEWSSSTFGEGREEMRRLSKRVKV